MFGSLVYTNLLSILFILLIRISYSDLQRLLRLLTLLVPRLEVRTLLPRKEGEEEEEGDNIEVEKTEIKPDNGPVPSANSTESGKNCDASQARVPT